ncbi:hypothetical protein CLU79DRAFT_451138 [Phycomyces nitens]|nr:hypothetical protein CLU79DRAFT_451138 [Phycomyces nitens]
MSQHLLFVLIEEIKESNRGLVSGQAKLLAEIQSLRDENTVINQRLIKLQADLSLRDRLDSGLGSCNPSIAQKEIGLFSEMLYPPRCYSDPRDADGQRRQFGWGLYKQLAWDVLGPFTDGLTINDLGICVDNVRRSHMINSVIDKVNNEYEIDKHTTWGNLSIRAQNSAALYLEELAAPHLPLRACVGNWGAKMMLRKLWNNARPENGQNSEENGSYMADPETSDCTVNSPRPSYNVSIPSDTLYQSNSVRMENQETNELSKIGTTYNSLSVGLPCQTSTAKDQSEWTLDSDNCLQKGAWASYQGILETSFEEAHENPKNIVLKDALSKYKSAHIVLALNIICGKNKVFDNVNKTISTRKQRSDKGKKRSPRNAKVNK